MIINKILAATLLFLLAGCSREISVYADYDPDYDLWEYTTFDWAPNTNPEAGKNPLYHNELNNKRIKSVALEQLNMRGYKLKTEKPDLILYHYIVIEEKAAIVTEPYGYYYGPYWRQMKTDVYPYRKGTLILDLMDAKTHNLIWRGWAVSLIDENYDSREIERLIKSAVVRIFKNFPTTFRPRPSTDNVVSN